MGEKVRVEEAYTERDETIDAEGNTVEVEIPYFVFGVTDESTALRKAKDAAKSVEGMSLDSVEVMERVNGTTWKVKAVYAVSEGGEGEGTSQGEDEYSFAFDTGGGSKHMTQSIATDGRYPKDAPDFGGAIGVDAEGNVNGTDVTMPVLNFTETHTMDGLLVTTQYKKTVAALTGSVNNGSFRGFETGEVLFLGASGSKRSKKAEAPWEITFRFAVSPNQAGFKVGDITVARKYGWDYLWTRYASKVENAKAVVKKPSAVYVEQVYPGGDFGKLGIGN